jgi:hypothetical protein
MLFAFLIIAAVYLVGLVVLADAIWRAPEGVEDDRGFREGRFPEEETDERR